MHNRIINFNAGPSALPESVLEEAKESLLNYKSAGMSVMEMSHRSREFEEILAQTKQKIISLLDLKETHEVLFLQGGASMQFAMLPMNFGSHGAPIDLINSGSWTKKALGEIRQITTGNVLASSEEDNFLTLPKLTDLHYSDGAAYLHMCSNNTIFGTQFKSFPQTGKLPLVCDMSSDILSRPLPVDQFSVIFAGAQKNLGPSGVALVIIDKNFAETGSTEIPKMLQYRTHISNNSLYNTPPTFGIYMIGLVADWIEKQGGLKGIEAHNEVKAKVLYDAIENNDLFYSPVEPQSRSLMNVVFRIKNNHVDLETQFVKEATAAGLVGLKGHRSVGGLRASIYNAQPLKNIEALVDFMETFAQKNG